MTLEGIIVGLFAILIGGAFCFAGFKWFLILLPIWGFLAGFVFGSNLIFYIFGADHGFFESALAIVTGLIAGVGFAVLSYLYYYFAVILLGASIGYLLGVGLMDLLNLAGAEILTFIVGIVVGGIVAFGFMILHMPAVLAIWGTAIADATAIVGGIVIALGRAPLDALNTGTLGSVAADTQYPWLWVIIGIGLAIAGAMAQIRMIGGMTEAIQKTQYKNPGMPPA